MPPVEEDIDEQLINEIEDYLRGIMENNERVIEMSDSPIKSGGAKCVAMALNFCEGLVELRLSNCEITDSGALEIFKELQGSRTVEVVDLSRNPLTERCFDALENLLNENKRLKCVQLDGTNVKSNFAWAKFKKFGPIVQH